MAALRQDNGIVQPMHDRRPHPPEAIEARGPIGFAFLYPFPGERPLAMHRIVVPWHPPLAMPMMPPLRCDGFRADTHHVEGRCNENQSIDKIMFLRHEPGDPASQ